MEIQPIGSVTTTTPVQSGSASENVQASKTGQAAPQKGGGTPPAGGKGGAKPAAASQSSSSSSSSTSTAKTYDKRDTNKDGVVSYEEELLYALKHPTEETDDSSTSTSQKQVGLNAYQQGQGTNTQAQNSTSA